MAGCRVWRSGLGLADGALDGQRFGALPSGAAPWCNSAAAFCPSRTRTPHVDLWPPPGPVLIRLKKKGDRCAVRSQFVQPICLPEPSTPFPTGHKCQIAGWGHQDESERGWEQPAGPVPGGAPAMGASRR